MEQYFNNGFFEGMNMIVSIMQELALIIGVPLAGLSYLKIMNELRSNPASNMMMAMGRFIKPTIIFFLIFTFNSWTDIVGGAVYNIGEYLQGEYDERLSKDARFTDEEGNAVDPWLHYQDLMIQARERENNKAAAIVAEYQNLPDDQKTEANGHKYYKQLQQEVEDDPSYIGQQVTNVVFKAVDWLIEGAYFIIVLVIEKLQQGLLAVCMATGILALLISLIPGREQSFDTWLTYFLSIQLWSALLVILKIYYNASILAEIDNLSQMINSGNTAVDYMNVSIEYIANCVTYLLLFCMVPVLVGIFMVRTGGSEMFSKLITMASAGTMATAQYGGKAASGAGQATSSGINAIERMSNRTGSLTNLSK